MISNKYINNLYVMCVALTLALHVYNLGGADTLKPFHITAVISFVLSFFVVPFKGKIIRYAAIFVLCSLLSALFSNSDTAIPFWINLVVILGSCYGLVYIDIKKLLKWLYVLIPIDVAVLLYTATRGYMFRFQGFYDDPNYLCTTLIGFLLVCLLQFLYVSNKWAKGLTIITIVGIYAIILMTISRTGLFCSLLILVFFFLNSIKKNVFKVIVVSLVGIFVMVHYAGDFIEKQTGAFSERLFDANDNYESAEIFRKELSLQNIRYIADNPQYILFGLGGGTTTGVGAAQVAGLNQYRKDSHGDHNTWTSTFSEQGLLALIYFFLIIFMTYKNIVRSSVKTDRYLLLAVFFSIILFSFSISQKVYLPFWWVIFFLNNKYFSSLQLKK